MTRNYQNIVANKRIFVSPTESDLECLKLYLTQRIEAGQGECFVQLGVGEGQDPGLSPADMKASVEILESLAKQLNAHLIHLRDRNAPINGTTSASPPQSNSTPVGAQASKKKKSRGKTKPNQNSEKQETGAAPTSTQPPVSAPNEEGFIVKDFLLRQAIEEKDFIDIRIAVVGNVDAGKSTMLGVLTHGELDNGRGLARQHLFRHKHEMESGRTSSVGNNILGFDVDGRVVNRATHGKLDWAQICSAATKVITFIDLAGHERYLKTTVFGLTGFAPDFVMLMIGANAGIIGMTKEHLGLALALNVPVFVVITKIDMCPPNILEETMKTLSKILKSPGCRKIPVQVNNRDDVVFSALNFTSERMCPIFQVSNVTGEKLELLQFFLNLIPTPDAFDDIYRLDRPASFQIDELFTVPGVGSIVSGTLMSGRIQVNDTLHLGPDISGHFHPVMIKSIQRKKMPVTKVRAGQTASFAFKRSKCSGPLRRGMVLLGKGMELTSCMHFSATVLVLHHPTTISVGYQAMVHAGPVRQTATILAIGAGSGEERLRTGDKAEVHFAFINHPEYLVKGVRLIFREGKTKAVGTVQNIVPYVPVMAPPVGGGRSRKAQKAPSRLPTALPLPQSAETE